MKAKRGLLSTAAEPKQVTQHLAIDDFGELPARKRDAETKAKALGHVLGRWKRRPNDPYGRWNAHCAECNDLVVVAVEPPPGLPLVYGKPLDVRCGSGR